MAPKNKKTDEVNPQALLLGRSKNSLSLGFVALPNVGKSLTFNCLAKC